MTSENVFLIHSFFMGIYITFVYDLLRIFRRVIPHGIFWISVEDIGFWIYCAGKVFLLMHYESNGKIRWFAVIGAVTGMLMYRRLFGIFFVKYVSGFLCLLLERIKKILCALFSPLRRVIIKIRDKAYLATKRRIVKREKKRRCGMRFVKKRLTLHKKVNKMDS